MLRRWRRNREHRTKPQAEHWFPTTLHPAECVYNPRLECIRDDHQHGDK